MAGLHAKCGTRSDRALSERRASRDHLPACRPTATATTEQVYRHELRPALTEGAEVMDKIFGPTATDLRSRVRRLWRVVTDCERLKCSKESYHTHNAESAQLPVPVRSSAGGHRLTRSGRTSCMWSVGALAARGRPRRSMAIGCAWKGSRHDVELRHELAARRDGSWSWPPSRHPVC
jgi:hypothetical protein